MLSSLFWPASNKPLSLLSLKSSFEFSALSFDSTILFKLSLFFLEILPFLETFSFEEMFVSNPLFFS